MRIFLALTLFVLTLSSCDSVNPLDNLDPEKLRNNGLDPTLIGDLLEDVAQLEFGRVESILIRRNGILSVEAYYHGVGRNHLVNIYGVTQNITSLMTAVAMEEELISRDSLVHEFLDDYVDEERESEFDDITVDHLMDMRSGFLWDELSTTYNFLANPRNVMQRSGDWIGFMMDQRFFTQPGERWSYNSGNSILLSAALETTTDSTLEAYTAEKLFEPLGIEDWIWQTGPDSLTNGGWGLFIRPTALSDIGQMVLQEGEWDGQQIVPAEFIQGLYEPNHTFTTGNAYNDLWWLGAGRDNVTDDFIIYGSGYGGQHLYVVPSLDMVIVVTGANFFNNGTNMRRMLWDYIFPAAL